MSGYHLMRNFTALLRMLGYSRLVSMDNFRRPNFALMADIVCFLLRRFDPGTMIEPTINTEEERLEFVRRASREMVSKAHLDINTKKLYMADMNCVPEMLKLLQVIHDAWRKLDPNDLNIENLNDSPDGDFSVNRSQFTNYSTNQLSSEILQLGTDLFDLLEHEQTQKIARNSVLNKQLPLDQIERALRQSIQELQAFILKMQTSKDNFDQDSEELNNKIEKKFSELERNRKRLQSLHSQRPVFMDELERVEQDISIVYEEYVTKARCLYFLEQKLEEFEEAERAKIEERNEEIRIMLEQMNKDDLMMNDNGLNGNQQNLTTINMDEELDIPSDDGDGISDDMSDSLERKTATLPSGNDDTKQNILRKPSERKMMANTVVVGNQRSSRTARIYSYGSLLGEDGEEDDDDDDDDEDDDDENIVEDDDDDEEIDDKAENVRKKLINNNTKKSESQKVTTTTSSSDKNGKSKNDSDLDLDTIGSDLESSDLASGTDFNINTRLQNTLRTTKLPSDGNDDF